MLSRDDVERRLLPSKHFRATRAVLGFARGETAIERSRRHV
ncbi:hypothetical protein AKJ09_03373 [Labilithrix luteola]|uniref:Uncharacterized protein n=1 Tax=Labilithrix luteola TaxID=1391654 RepID=A0A0K1PUC4_9BACT|nr:hypothetical protein AKJ09_03373 [Labilithrix luteola]